MRKLKDIINLSKDERSVKIVMQYVGQDGEKKKEEKTIKFRWNKEINEWTALLEINHATTALIQAVLDTLIKLNKEYGVLK